MPVKPILFRGGPRDGRVEMVHHGDAPPLGAERTDPAFNDETHIGIAVYFRRSDERVDYVEQVKTRGGVKEKKHRIYVLDYEGTIIRDRETLLVLGEEKPAHV